MLLGAEEHVSDAELFHSWIVLIDRIRLFCAVIVNNTVLRFKSVNCVPAWVGSDQSDDGGSVAMVTKSAAVQTERKED